MDIGSTLLLSFYLPVEPREIVHGGPVAENKGDPQEKEPQAVQHLLDTRHMQEKKKEAGGLGDHLIFPHAAGIEDEALAGGKDRKPVMMIHGRRSENQQAWTFPRGMSIMRTAEVRSLSARGSRSFPTEVTWLCRRARMPSR